MEFVQTVDALQSYDLWLIFIGVAILATSALPRHLKGRPLSMPMATLALGYVVVALPLGLDPLSPVEHGTITETYTFTVEDVAEPGEELLEAAYERIQIARDRINGGTRLTLDEAAKEFVKAMDDAAGEGNWSIDVVEGAPA